MPRTVGFMRYTALSIVEKHSNYDIMPNCIWAPQKGANMGKDRNGKELGKGLSQRTGRFKNGKEDRRYVANFYGKDGKRVSRAFETLKDAKQWLADSKYKDDHYLRLDSEKITVNEWFEKWIEGKKATVRYNTARNYRERYEHNIKDVIGRMRMVDVKPIHCQRILNKMDEKGYKRSTMSQTRITLTSMFLNAVDNGIIHKSPITKSGVVIPSIKKPEECNGEWNEARNIRFFTIDEQRKFISVAKDYAYYPQFRLILELGLRTSELVGLEWSAISFEKRELTVRKTLEYRYSTKQWILGPPKTTSGYRTISLTDIAFEILQQIKNSPSNINEKTPDEFKDLVFINRTGFPTNNSTYDAALTKRCEKAKVTHLSMHGLRHTYASRFCEQSNDYKTLSENLGHSNIGVTMNVYAHKTSEYKKKEAGSFSDYIKSLSFD